MNRNTIIGIYLAAGQSTRMGSNKLQLPLGNMSLGNYALAAALNSRLDYVRVITNDVMADWMDSTFYRDPIKQKWSKMYCPEAHLGQAYSLRCGIRAALALEVRAVMILLADQPLITSEMINELLIRYQMEWANHIPYVASSCDGLARPPVFLIIECCRSLCDYRAIKGLDILFERKNREYLTTSQTRICSWMWTP